MQLIPDPQERLLSGISHQTCLEHTATFEQGNGDNFRETSTVGSSGSRIDEVEYRTNALVLLSHRSSQQQNLLRKSAHGRSRRSLAL